MNRSFLRNRRVLLAAVPALVALLGSPTPGHALGFELTTPGAREAGRSGASVAGADNAMGLFYNPATILAGTSTTDTAIALHSSWTELCFTRTAVIENADMSRSAGAVSPEVCSDAKTSLVPVGASTWRLNDKFALAIGVYSPPAAGRDIRFGNKSTGTPDGRIAASTADLSGSRYLLMDEHILQTFPTIGAAWAPIKQLRIGASFGWGFTNFNFSTATFSRVIASRDGIGGMEIGGTSDAGSYVSGKDTFTPRISAGLWTKPVESIPVELGLSFVYTGDVETDSAKLRIRNLHTDYYPSSLVGLLGTPMQPAIDATFKKTGVVVPQNSVLSAGLRYAKKLATPRGKHGDRMATELFDIEVNYAITFARTDSVDVTPPPGSSISIPSPSPGLVPDSSLVLPNEISLAHKWKNQSAIRIGGDYNVIPNLLSLRAGYSYESDGVTKGYHQLDFQPHKRFGVSLGATVRIIDMIDVSATYAHLIIPDVNTSVQDAGVRRATAGEPRPGEAEIANAGKITQTASAFIVEVGYHL